MPATSIDFKSLVAGKILGDYRIESLLGQGGMAKVYRVAHTQRGTHHALKLITSDRGLDRLTLEGEALSSLDHPNIARVTEIIEVEGTPGLVLELIEGPSLKSWRKEHEPTLAELNHLVRGILRGLSVAHERGMVHRDLKPGNVMLAPLSNTVEPKLLDFGLVKQLYGTSMTVSGAMLGTPSYMSPEQARNSKHVDTRSDVFSMGAMIYFLASGVSPFKRRSSFGSLAAIVNADRRPLEERRPGLPEPLYALVKAALQVDREERPADAAALLERWEQIGDVGPLDLAWWSKQLRPADSVNADAEESTVLRPGTQTSSDTAPSATRSGAATNLPLLLAALGVGVGAIGLWAIWG